MNSDSASERYFEHLFGEPLHISNFLTINRENGWDYIFASSREIVQFLIMKGNHELLSGLLLNTRNRGVVLGNMDIANGKLLVQLAAFSSSLIMTNEIMGAARTSNERKKAEEAMCSLVKIAKDQKLGKYINNFAQRQVELLELRMETPSKMRWLNGTGRLQARLKSNIRSWRTQQAIKHQTMLAFR